MMNQPLFSGWRRDDEDWNIIRAMPGIDDLDPMMRARGYEYATVDPRKALKVEDQGQQGACQGHAVSTCTEWAHIIQMGSNNLQLSRAYGYYESQRIDSISGDSGSTITGGCKLASTTGIPEERLWPYPGSYNSRRPGGWSQILTNALMYKIGKTYRLRTYKDISQFLGAGQGGINIGMSWGSSMNKPVVENFQPGGGGHAISLISMSERTDSNGDHYVWMLNSWGKRFGNDGWSEWAPRAVRKIMDHNFSVAIGLSDLPNISPRPWDLDRWQKELRVI